MLILSQKNIDAESEGHQEKPGFPHFLCRYLGVLSMDDYSAKCKSNGCPAI